MVRGWLAKALNASRGPQWICAKCNHVHEAWEPVCDNCGAFDTLDWKAAPHSGDTGLSTSAMLPLIVGSLEDDHASTERFREPGPRPGMRPRTPSPASRDLAVDTAESYEPNTRTWFQDDATAEKRFSRARVNAADQRPVRRSADRVSPSRSDATEAQIAPSSPISMSAMPSRENVRVASSALMNRASSSMIAGGQAMRVIATPGPMRSAAPST